MLKGGRVVLRPQKVRQLEVNGKAGEMVALPESGRDRGGCSTGIAMK